ncbi:hypothetical protein [Gracilinema caldarium]|uniref:Uncharacterized protein n=1 Tax=Gracilinema caldarium (strain ATCC 51460 / DSM 7334 / H1) TaxID=744872 RepID=F8F249_GRAC1|nr:hypothetical protein [Gracilinema caldarium]AEJ20321.1 hypothetical protein Spica_2201 [Gracilinema caldarium DSM 7334]
MKMFLEGFQELDHGELIKVNGGYATIWADTTNNTAVQNNGYSNAGSLGSGYSTNSSIYGYIAIGSVNPYGNVASAVPAEQVCTNPDDYHCDIIAYNEAVEHGVSNPGTGDWNKVTVNTIYENQFATKAGASFSANQKGYIFYDDGNDGTMDHMEYFEASADGHHYTVWTTDGKNNPTPTVYDYNSDINGHAKTGTIAKFVVLQ